MCLIRIGAWILAAILSTSVVHGGGPQLGARATAEWVATLENPERINGMKIDEVVTRLALRPGNVVADVGAGAGAFAAALANAVSPGGTVYAVDIDQGLLDHIAVRAKQVGLTNVKVVLGKYTDPALPVRNIDVALIYDVLHHIQARDEYLKALAGYMAPRGRIAIVDFREGHGGHGKDPTQQITRQQADAWLAAAGFKPAEEIELFEEKWFVVYSR
jgi:ubiquinone/menaquinone biosynthesis C-methylase UbiE